MSNPIRLSFFRSRFWLSLLARSLSFCYSSRLSVLPGVPSNQLTAPIACWRLLRVAISSLPRGAIRQDACIAVPHAR